MAIDLFLGKTTRDWARETSASRVGPATERKIAALLKPVQDAGITVKSRGRGAVILKKWKF
jgi:hypothetical protein